MEGKYAPLTYQSSSVISRRACGKFLYWFYLMVCFGLSYGNNVDWELKTFLASNFPLAVMVNVLVMAYK